MVLIPFTRKRDKRGVTKPTLSGKIIQLSTEAKNLRQVRSSWIR
jgi:hypothetical protein